MTEHVKPGQSHPLGATLTPGGVNFSVYSKRGEAVELLLFDANDNRSWNCGVEGPTDDPAVERLRKRQIKNLCAVNLLALGVPMILMGDEVRRSQQGNNNGYCQDNETSWFDWTLAEDHAEIHRFVKRLIQFRQIRPARQESPRRTLNELLRQARIRWHGVELGKPDWSEHSHTAAFTLQSPGGEWYHMMFHAYWEALVYELPPLPGNGATHWRRLIDTYLESPDDICRLSEAPAVDAPNYLVQPRSVVLLMAEIAEIPDRLSAAEREEEARPPDTVPEVPGQD